jgi:3-hydroxyacyl-CoA dehydrogenase
MGETVRTERHEDVLAVLVDNPPVNALSPGLAEALAAAVKEGEQDPAIRVVVVMGAGRTFIAGADIREFPQVAAGEKPPPDFNAALAAIEDCQKPVVMAIHGAALGGGLETAMAGHYRVAVETAQVGQPEVKLGLIPGAGGTQRLPRLAGLEAALEMCAFGEPVAARRALELGILDAVIEGDLLAGAIAFARAQDGPRRTRDLPVRGAETPLIALRAECEKRMRRQDAPLKALEAVAAAGGLGFAEGLAFERKLFLECLYGEQSRALIHVFFAEREAAKLPFLSKDAKPPEVRRAAVVGAGMMGGGIAMCYANAGLPVLLKDTGEEALQRGLEAIRNNYESSVRKGKLAEEEAARRMALITPADGWEGFEQADVIVEAVFEDLELKKRVFRELDAVARPGAILATNTSTLSVDALAAETKRPEAVVGHHFFSPAQVMRLLEIVRGKATGEAALAASLDLARRLKKVAVVAGDRFGFIGNRMFMAYRAQAVLMAEQGASPWEIDRALTDWGMAMGPLAVGDLVGLDVFWHMRREALGAGVPYTAPRVFEDLLYDQGRYGQKHGSGWYRYGAGRKPSPEPEVEVLLREYAAAQAIPQRRFGETEIAERCLYALVNEGGRLLEAGAALRPGDIDVVYTAGYGFPAWRGGPMHWAETVGRGRILDAITRWYDEEGPFWKPSAWLHGTVH